MITSFELKNKGMCGTLYRIPYWIKNLFLLGVMMAIIIPVYLVHFRKDTIVVSNVYKILHGLNHKTMNFIAANDKSLQIHQQVKELPLQTGSVEFYSNCVSVNRPCIFRGLARPWKAFEQWRSSKKQGEALKKDIGVDSKVNVFYDPDMQVELTNFDWHSFEEEAETTMKYSEFLTLMNYQAAGVTMRERDHQNQFKAAIDLPEFYDDLAEMKFIELFQAQLFVTNNHYERDDQFICAIDGELKLRMVPHIYRQELVEGTQEGMFDSAKDWISSRNPIGTTRRRIPGSESEEKDGGYVNESPVNLFAPDYEKYPNLNYIKVKQSEVLSAGDCIFMPSFYYYQMIGKAEDRPGKAENKPYSLVASIHYAANSDLLQAFYNAIEDNILE